MVSPMMTHHALSLYHVSVGVGTQQDGVIVSHDCAASKIKYFISPTLYWHVLYNTMTNNCIVLRFFSVDEKNPT